VYTLQVRVWRRIRTQWRKRVLRWQPMDLLDYVSGPVAENVTASTTTSSTSPV
jgi:hypothetical protein